MRQITLVLALLMATQAAFLTAGEAQCAESGCAVVSCGQPSCGECAPDLSGSCCCSSRPTKPTSELVPSAAHLNGQERLLAASSVIRRLSPSGCDAGFLSREASPHFAAWPADLTHNEWLALYCLSRI